MPFLAKQTLVNAANRKTTIFPCRWSTHHATCAGIVSGGNSGRPDAGGVWPCCTVVLGSLLVGTAAGWPIAGSGNETATTGLPTNYGCGWAGSRASRNKFENPLYKPCGQPRSIRVMPESPSCLLFKISSARSWRW